MDEINTVSPQTTPKRFNPKVILLVLAVVVLAEIIFAVKTLTSPTPRNGTSKTSLGLANIALILPKSEYNVGDTLPIKIRVDTNNNKTSGTDVILRFDPNILEATGAGVLVKGTLYPDYPVASVDGKTGLVTISGISPNKENGFSGTGVLATVNLRAKTKGETKVTIDFTPDSIKDSNILDANSSRDLLQKVMPLQLTIK